MKKIAIFQNKTKRMTSGTILNSLIKNKNKFNLMSGLIEDSWVFITGSAFNQV